MDTLNSLLAYVPVAAHHQVTIYLERYNISVLVKPQRHSKHGDFRYYSDGRTQITINKMENSYRFLITLIHELAHFDTFKSYQKRVKPHGIEWKDKFRFLMLPFLNPNVFPEPLLTVIARHLKNPKASSDSDFELVMSLKKFDKTPPKTHVFELQQGTRFKIYNGREFLMGKKRVKRYECKELTSGRTYLLSPHAEVTICQP